MSSSIKFLNKMYKEGKISSKKLLENGDDNFVKSITNEDPIKDPFVKGYYQILQEVSYKCNAHCSYCMNRGLDYSIQESPIEDFIAFYDKIIQKGATIRLQITGGEPVQPNVIERTNALVKYAQTHDEVRLLQINTNGYWEIPDEWACSKLLIQFSLDGDAKYIEKITGLNGLYERLLANFDKCDRLGIKYQTKTVINPDNEKFVEPIVQLISKHNMIPKMQWTLPVGGAVEANEKDDLLTMLDKTKYYEDLYNESQRGGCRGCIGYCFRVYKQVYEEDPVIPMVITPSGQIGLCAFLATEYMTDYTIYNFDVNKPYRFVQHLRNTLGDRTCSFPKGFKKFYNSLTEEEKNKIDYFVTEKDNSNGNLTLKDFYNL